MKILLTVDPEIPVPPVNYGGIERIVDALANHYNASGHEVILVANESSSCSGAKRIYGWKGEKSQDKWDIIRNARDLWAIYKKEKPDIIHSFSRLLYLYPLFLFTNAKVIQSYQRKINKRSTNLAIRLAGDRIEFTACAAHMFKDLPHQAKWHAIHNFTDTNKLYPDYEIKREYLLFLGRIQDIKGCKEAIDAALYTKERLVIAGNIPKEHQSYFEESIAPHIDGKQIDYVGPVNDEQKRKLFQKAKAFLFPIKWEEPFGIVMAESLACGTPVVAFNRGSVPEVIQSGVNGYVVKDVQEMGKIIPELDKLDHKQIVKIALQRFSASQIGDAYLSLFNQFLKV